MIPGRFITAAVLVLLAGCAPTAPANAPPAQPPTDAQPAPQTDTTAIAATENWGTVVAAANQEGTILLIGPAGTDVPKGLVDGFQQRYPAIHVDLEQMSGPDEAARVLAEQAAGKFLDDLTVQGSPTIMGSLAPGGATVPLQPWLVGPDDQDPSQWLNGQFVWADSPANNNLVMSGYVQIAFAYNPSVVDASEFHSWKDLLDPKWKGKIIMRDPRQPGALLGHVDWWLDDPRLGKQYIQDLFVGQDVMISDDDRQIIDSVAGGQYPIALGPSNTQVNVAINRGLPIAMLDGAAMAEGTYLAQGNGSIGVFRNPPHPNATKVYLNYLLSQEGQQVWSSTQGFASFRRDVPSDSIAPILVPKEGVSYHDGFGQAYMAKSDEAVAYLTTLLGST